MIRRLVGRDAKLKLLSLALAIVAWVYLRLVGAPVVTESTRTLTVPIEVTGASPHRRVTLDPREVTVQLDAATVETPSAFVDLSHIPEGRATVPVQVRAGRAIVRSLAPATTFAAVSALTNRRPVAL